MLLATAGHVDHGKTSLVRALTGVDTDRLAEEQARGLTIDLGFAYLPVTTDQGEVRLGFIDVPGHERFVHNMLAGVAGIHHALLVVAADDGVMPQTREHLEVLALLGVPAVTPVVNKVDRVDTQRVDAVCAAVADLLDSAGMTAMPAHRVSATGGQGVDGLRTHLDSLAAAHQPSAAAGAFRLCVDRAFVLGGAGLVATGTVHSGSVHSGDHLLHLPGSTRVRVRSLRVHDQPAERADTGQRVALNLSGLDRQALSRGHWLVDAARPEDSRRLHVLARPVAQSRPLRPHTPVTLHLAASRVRARLSPLDAASLEPGAAALAELLLDAPLPARWGDRLVLRDDGGEQTLAGARVLDAFPPPRGRRGAAHLAWLANLDVYPVDGDPASLLAAHPNGLSQRRLAANLNLDAPAEQALVAAAASVDLGQDKLLLDPAHWASLQDKVADTVQAWHRQSPQTAGINDQQLLTLTRELAPQPVLRAVAASLVSAGRLRRSGSLLHHPEHQAQLHGADADHWARIGKALDAAGMPPPVVHDLAGVVKMPPRELQQVLERLAHQGLVIRVAANRFFRPADVLTLARQAAALSAASPDGEFTARAFRDAAGIGRNLAIEALEFFDVKGLTRRLGDQRRVVKAVDEVF